MKILESSDQITVSATGDNGNYIQAILCEKDPIVIEIKRYMTLLDYTVGELAEKIDVLSDNIDRIRREVI